MHTPTLTPRVLLSAARTDDRVTVALRNPDDLDAPGLAEAASALIRAGASVSDVARALGLPRWGGSVLCGVSTPDDTYTPLDLAHAHPHAVASDKALDDVAREIVEGWDVDCSRLCETGGVEVTYSISATVVHPDGEIEELSGSASHTHLPPEPECPHAEGHDWRTTHPKWGAWATGGTGLAWDDVCVRCGCWRASWSAGVCRDPGRPTETVRYRPAGESRPAIDVIASHLADVRDKGGPEYAALVEALDASEYFSWDRIDHPDVD